MVLALVLAPTNHVVRDNAAFIAPWRQGLVAADAGRIVTFGIQPERAATEYGHVNHGDAVSDTPRRRKVRQET